jgi:hypothetical protein
LNDLTNGGRHRACRGRLGLPVAQLRLLIKNTAETPRMPAEQIAHATVLFRSAFTIEPPFNSIS